MNKAKADKEGRFIKLPNTNRSTENSDTRKYLIFTLLEFPVRRRPKVINSRLTHVPGRKPKCIIPWRVRISIRTRLL